MCNAYLTAKPAYSSLFYAPFLATKNDARLDLTDYL